MRKFRLSAIVALSMLFVWSYALAHESFDQRKASFSEIWDIVQKKFIRTIPDTAEEKGKCLSTFLAKGLEACLDDSLAGYYTAEEWRKVIVTEKESRLPTSGRFINTDETFISNGEMFYVQINDFSEKTPDEIYTALRKVCFKESSKNIAKSDVIFDVRDNPGGSLYAFLRTAYIFTQNHQDIVITIQSRSEENKTRVKDMLSGLKLEESTHALPGEVTPCIGRIIVLVNRKTASAAEAFALLLKDWKHAFIIGENTSGKGTITTSYPLAGGDVIEFTTHRYLIGNAQLPIPPDGIILDYLVADDPRRDNKITDFKKDPQLHDAMKILLFFSGKTI